MKHKVAQFYIKEIKEALKMFGEYTYYDKGPEEVMEVDFKPLLKLPQKERIQVVKELMAYKHGPNFLDCLGIDGYYVKGKGVSEKDLEELMAIVEPERK